jgi:hypothetical protein
MEIGCGMNLERQARESILFKQNVMGNSSGSSEDQTIHRNVNSKLCNS